MKKYIILMVSSLLTTVSYATSTHIKEASLDTQTGQHSNQTEILAEKLQILLDKEIKLYHKRVRISPQNAVCRLLSELVGSIDPSFREVLTHKQSREKIDELIDCCARYILLWKTLKACNCPILIPMELCWLHGVLNQDTAFDLSRAPDSLQPPTEEMDSIINGIPYQLDAKFYQEKIVILSILIDHLNKCIKEAYASLPGQYKVPDATPFVREFTRSKHRFTIAQPSEQHKGETFTPSGEEGEDVDKNYDFCFTLKLSRLAGKDRLGRHFSFGPTIMVNFLCNAEMEEDETEEDDME